MARVSAVRGATTTEANTSEAILAATEELLAEILSSNELQPQDLISAIFTVSPDLTAIFPAVAARKMGLTELPMLCAQEIPVPDSLPRCVRVLIHVSSENLLKPVYLHEAKRLRPDLA